MQRFLLLTEHVEEAGMVAGYVRDSFPAAEIDCITDTASCTAERLCDGLTPPPDLIVADCQWLDTVASHGSGGALSLLSGIREYAPEAPVLLLARNGDQDRVLRLVSEAAAVDYVGWDDLRRLGMAARRALEYRDLRRERARLQAQLVHAGRLTALGELVAGVAHEINNPLAAIGGHAQLLAMHPVGDVREDALIISRLVDRINRIVHSLRNFARPNTGGGRRRPSDLNRVVEEALLIMEYRLRRGSIDVVQELASDLPKVPMNSGEIEQVLVNLLNNAEHALRGKPPESRRVTISTTIGAAPGGSGHWCQLTVTDTGCGVSEEVLSHLFEPFFTTKDAGEGTGLGMYISQGLVAAHGGTLTIDSRPGEGARVTVSLPLDAGHTPSAINSGLI
jgi:signal transduction histidine kinase